MKKKLLIATILLLLGISTIIYFKMMKTPDDKMYFVNTKLFINGDSGQEVTLPLIFLSKEYNNLKTIISSVEFLDSEYAEISKWEIKDGDKYKDCKFNNVSTILKLKKQGRSDLKGIRVNFTNGNRKEFVFKDWNVNVLSNNAQSNISVATKESYISSGNKSLFDLINTSKNLLKIDSINYNSDKVTLKDGNYNLKEKNYKSIKNLELAPNDTVVVNEQIVLNENFDICFIKPLVEYSIGENHYKESITNGTVFGLPFTEEKMQILYNDFNKYKK